jgi:hypothetical protein
VSPNLHGEICVRVIFRIEASGAKAWSRLLPPPRARCSLGRADRLGVISAAHAQSRPVQRKTTEQDWSDTSRLTRFALHLRSECNLSSSWPSGACLPPIQQSYVLVCWPKP